MKRRMTRRDYIYKSPTINSDTFDQRRFNELLHMSKGLQRVRDEGKEQPHFEQLMGDIWSGFFKNKPELLNSEEIHPDLAVNHQLMERVLNDDSFQETHEFTKLDDLHSALNTIGFSEKIFQWIEKMTDTNEKTSEAFDNVKQQETQNGRDSKEYNEALQEFMKALGKDIQNTSDSEFSEMLQQALDQTKRTEENLKNLVNGFEASKGDGELKQIPLRDQFALAEYLKNNAKMKDIARWAGRFKAIASSKQKSMSKESMARAGVTVGNDIDRILPSEMLNMANPIAKNDFLRRFVEGETLQYAKKGKQVLGKGPIILCLDQSGSMTKLDTQSKGFTLALMSIAKRQKRDFALVTFSDRCAVKQYPKGKITIDEMVSLCENFLDGGTNFKNPLLQSQKLINGSRFKNADIVFVTDGQDNLHTNFINKFNSAKEKLGFSVVGLLIGHGKIETVSQFADQIHHASDFNDKNAHDVFKI